MSSCFTFIAVFDASFVSRYIRSDFNGRNMLHDIEDIIYGFYNPHNKNFLLWFLSKNPLIGNITENFIRHSLELTENGQNNF